MAGEALMTSRLHRFLGDKAGRKRMLGLMPSSSSGDRVGGPLNVEDVSREGVNQVEASVTYKRREKTLIRCRDGGGSQV